MPLEVRRLDCNICPTITDFVIRMMVIFDIYFILSTEYKTQKLIFIVDDDTADAYMPDSTHVYSIGGSLPGVDYDFSPFGLAADDQGHLLVCDNEGDCVRMFSVDDGSYMDVVVSAEQGMTNPYAIHRCDDNRSMFIVLSNGRRRLDFVRIETDGVKEYTERVSFEDQLADASRTMCGVIYGKGVDRCFNCKVAGLRRIFSCNLYFCTSTVIK